MEKNARLNERFTRTVPKTKKNLLIDSVYLNRAEIAHADIFVTYAIAIHLSFAET